MTTEIVKKESTELSTQVQSQEPQFLNSDVIIPKVLLMQGLSELVNDRKAQQGDMVRSTTAEVLGGPGKPVDFIPLLIRNEWTLQEEIGGKFEYRGTEPRTAKNEDAPWDFEQNGAKWRRMKVINCFALLPQDIEAEMKEIAKFKETGEMPDLNKTLLPVVISFRSTSFNAGKGVATHFAKAASMAKYGVKPHGFSLVLDCYQDKNDKGSYYVYKVGTGKRVSAEALQKAEEWIAVLSTRQVKIDESDEAAGAMSAGETEDSIC